MIRAQAYIRKNRLIVLGVADLRSGPVPFSYSAALEDFQEDGPVDFGAELSPTVSRALNAGQEKIDQKIRTEKVKLAAEELVIRSRQGDQNAMAMLGAIGAQAKKGEPRARLAFKAVRDYIRNHPPDADFGSDGADQTENFRKIEALAKASSTDPIKQAIAVQIFSPSLATERAVVLLANGQPIGSNFVESILAPYPNPQLEQGIKHHRSKISKDADFRAGQIIGRARSLQKLRESDSSFKLASSGVAWELGEPI